MTIDLISDMISNPTSNPISNQTSKMISDPTSLLINLQSSEDAHRSRGTDRGEIIFCYAHPEQIVEILMHLKHTVFRKDGNAQLLEETLMQAGLRRTR